MSLSRLVADPPLDPPPDEARGQLRRELLNPEYQQDSLRQRFQDWLAEAFESGLRTASGVDGLTTLVALTLFALLAVGLAVLLSRLRRTKRVLAAPGAVFADEVVTADDLRRRALQALAAGDHAGALVDAFRALARRQVEAGRLDDLPGATAHEVATALESAYPPLRGRIEVAAGRFDEVRYGGRPANREQAESVLALDDDLVGVR